MAFPRSFISFFLLGALAACGRVVEAPFDPGPPVNTAPATTPTTSVASLFLVAQDGDTLVVMSVDPATADARPFGPALPVVAARYAEARVQASPDGLHAIVALSPSSAVGEPVPDDRPALVLAGDGASWRTITSATLTDLGAVVSPDASTVWVARLCNGTDYLGPARHELFSFGGTSLWKDDTCRQSNTFAPVGLSSDGALVTFVDQRSVSILERATGKVSSIASPSGPSVVATFPTSTIVAMDDHTVAWLAPDGGRLAVPGASTNAAAVVDTGHHLTAPAGIYQVEDGTLSLLRDRTVERIQTVPTGIGPNDIDAHFPGHYAIAGTADGAVSLVGLDGAVLVKRTAPAREGRVGGSSVVAHSFAGRWPWAVLTTTYVVAGTDVGDIDGVEELWLPGDPATGVSGHSHSLRTGTNLTPRSYFPSPDGEHALYLENGTLHSIAIATMTDDVVRKDLVWYE